MITKKQDDRCATHHYAFKTELILKDVGPIWMPNSVYSAIAVNIGNATLEGCIEPYDLAIAFIRGNDKLWHVKLFSDRDDVDCGAICHSFGGKGSVHEAEFDCRELPFEI